MLRSSRNGRAQRAKAIELQPGLETACVLGTGQMRQQAQRPHRSAAGEPRMRRSELLRPEAEPVHAGVDLQPDREALRAGVLLQHRDLLGRMHDELQIVLGRSVELSGGEHAFEHDDRLCDARRAQRERLFDARDRECIGIRERARCVHETVTVGIGLDGRHDARARREAADDREIVAQRGGVDRSTTGALHSNRLRP